MKNTWIKAESCEAPLFRRVFEANNIVEASIDICGLGFFELYVNGEKISEDLLCPAWSDYEPRENRRMIYPINDQFQHRVYFLRYDLTENLYNGKNALGVILGNGWYHQNKRNIEGDFWYGTSPILWLDLTIKKSDGSVEHIVSDKSFLWSPSPITSNNIYYGEHYDARMEQQDWNLPDFDDSNWNNALPAKAPSGEMTLQTCPTDKRIRELSPQLVNRMNGMSLYDAGQNITGWVKLKCNGKAGECIKICFAEEISDGRLNYSSCGGETQIQEDQYICTGSPNEIYEPRFTWHGFRYFEIEGNAHPISAVVVHSDISISSSFTSDSPILDRLYQTFIHTQLVNYHCGVPSDCPHRERLGYTGDGQLCCDAAMLMLDSKELYRKWMQDIADCQNLENGHVQHTAPFYGGGGGPGGWGCAIVEVPYQFWRHYGEIETVRPYYFRMLMWLNYMEAHSEDGLVICEEDGGWCLGDWCTPEEVKLPEPFVNTYFYLKSILHMIELAEILGETQDVPILKQKWEYVSNKFLLHYQNKETETFLDSIQGADAFALDIGLGSEKTLEALKQRYLQLGHFDTGIFGTDILIRVLMKYREVDLAYNLLTNRHFPSFQAEWDQGATTLWESWDGHDSHNHPMFGACTTELFYGILGLRQEKGSCCFEKPQFDPVLPTAMNKAWGSVQTPNGILRVTVYRDVNNNICTEHEFLE